jgi:hypothetical protein
MWALHAILLDVGTPVSLVDQEQREAEPGSAAELDPGAVEPGVAEVDR